MMSLESKIKFSNLRIVVASHRFTKHGHLGQIAIDLVWVTLVEIKSFDVVSPSIADTDILGGSEHFW